MTENTFSPNNNTSINSKMLNNISALCAKNSNNQSKNLDILLMEKDKEIINLSTLNKNLTTQLEDISRVLKEKEIQLLSLTTDVSSFENEKKILIEENNQLKSQISELSVELSSKNQTISEISKKNKATVSDINNAFNIQMKNYEDALKNIQNVQSNNNSLTEKLLIKDKEIVDLQKMLYELKQENKKIFNYQKDNTEKNKIIVELQKTITNQIKEIDKLKLINGSINNNYHFCKRCENDFVYNNDKPHSVSKNSESLLIHSNSNTNNNNNNELVNFIIDQIKNVVLSIDNNIVITNSIDRKSDIYLTVDNNMNKKDQNNFLHELIKQNFDLLINKINDKKIELIKTGNSLNNQQMQQEISELKEIISLKNNENQKLNNQLNFLIQKTNNNKENNTNKEDNNNINNNLNESLEKQYNEIFAKLKNFSDFYCGDLNKSTKKIDLKLPNFSLNDDNEKKLSDIIFTVKSLITYIENNNPNENDKKEEENDKIKEINGLLKQKEKYLNKIKKDNQKLKERNLQLENNILMISKSQNINRAKFANNNKPNFDNENKNYSLMKDFYNKNNKIKSLENMAKQIMSGAVIENRNKIENDKFNSYEGENYGKENNIDIDKYNNFENEEYDNNNNEYELNFNYNYMDDGNVNYNEGDINNYNDEMNNYNNQ